MRSLRQRTVRVPPLPFPQHRGKAWRDAHEAAQDLADLTEVQTRVEVLHEVEHVALGGALRVPPAAPIVTDDQDRAVAPAVFERTPCALLRIELPSWDEALEQGGAVHAATKQRQLGIMAGHRTVLLFATGGGSVRGWLGRPLHHALMRSADREADAGQGRRRRPRSGVPCGASGASGSARRPVLLWASSPRFCAAALRTARAESSEWVTAGRTPQRSSGRLGRSGGARQRQ